MSKQALALLAQEMKDTLQNTWQGSSNKFRKDYLDYQKTYVKDSTVEQIEAQLRIQVLKQDSRTKSSLYDAIEQQNGFTEAARIFLTTLNDSFTPQEKKAASDSPGIVAVVNNLDGLKKRRMAPAEKAAKDYLSRLIGTNLDYKLLSPDHTDTNADIRFSRSLYNVIAQTNPQLEDAGSIVNQGQQLLRELSTVPFGQDVLVSQTTVDYFLEAFTRISSRFTNDLRQKTFDISLGVEVTPRSQLDNEEAGRNETQSYVAQLASAAKQLVAKRDWAGQESSDSYRNAIMKQLNNAAVKAGATGSVKVIDATESTAEEKVRLRGTRKVNTAQIGSNQRAPKAPTKAATPLVNLDSIVAYINARLPDAVERNMGPESLVYRTGRFAASAKIADLTTTRQGYLSLGYTYQRSPYDVFDPVLGRAPWNTPSRDPRKIIEKSVRDIARDMTIGRFYLRRV